MGHRLLLAGWYVLALILVLTAVVNSITRLPSSLYQEYLPTFQETISSLIDKPVHIRAIHVNWYGYTPLIAVEGLSVYSDETKSSHLLAAEKATISLDLLDSLMSGNLVIKELQLSGSDLHAVRDKDHRIVLNGIDISERIARRKEAGRTEDIRFSLLASTIAIQDEILGHDYHFDQVDIVLRFHEEKLRISSKVSLPDSLGDSLLLGADLEDLDQGLDDIRGEVYAKGENINLEQVDDFFPQLSLVIHNGRSDFEIWGDLESEHEWSFEGSLAFHDLEYRPVTDPLVDDGHAITALDTRFRVQGLQDTWHLAFIESDIRSAGHKWVGEEYEVRCIRCGGDAAEPAVAVALDHFDSANLLATLQHFPVFSKPLRALLTQARIDGEFTDTRIQLQLHDEQLAKYAYHTVLQEANVSVPAHGLELSRLSGKAAGDHLHGSFLIDSPAVQVHARQLKEHAFPEQAVTGRFLWEFADHGTVIALENVSLKTEGLQADLQGTAYVGQDSSQVDIQAGFPEVQIAALKSWLPDDKLGSELASWLEQGQTGGTLNDVRLLLQGDPRHIPFGHHPGRLEIRADIQGVSLSPHEKSPEIHDLGAHLAVINQRLEIHGDQGRVSNASILGFDIAIDDILQPLLVVQGSIRGPAPSILEVLQKSSLIPQDDQEPANVSMAGMVDLGLDLSLPLADTVEEEARVAGTIEFKNVDLTMGLASLAFTDLNGILEFSDAGIESEGLSARLHGSDFHANAFLLENGATRMQIRGELDFDAWLDAGDLWLAPHVRGKAPVSATIDLHPPDDTGQEKPLAISMESDLVDIVLALPEPFGKQAGTPMTLDMHSQFLAGRDNTLSFNYGDRIFAQGLLDAGSGQLRALEIRVGDDRFDLPAEGMRVSGTFGQLDVDQWQDLLGPADVEGSLELREVDIRASTVSLPDMMLTDVGLSLHKDVNSWTGTVDSQTMRGTFEYPHELDAESIVAARLDYLHYDYLDEEFTFDVNPRDLPALDIQIVQFESDGLLMNDVSLKTEPSARGMIIDSLAAEGDGYRLEATGTWDMDVRGTHHTDMALELAVRNLHDTLTGLGEETAVNKGKGVVSAELSWPGMPDQFSLESFAGTATLRLKDGEITTVDPGGAGRLVGLFNLAEVSRRLTLDFSDFFSEGYVFDKIRGTLVFEDGNLTTENLRFDGPSADMQIAGRTGIVARDYDQIITVTPHVTGGLPWLGIGLGPVGVGGIYILGKIGEKVGIDVDEVVDKVVEVKYHMTGSWDDPQIEPVAQKIAESEPPQETP